MIYAATCFWLIVAVLLAWGVYDIWAKLVPPRTLRFVLAPATVISECARVVGLLITGAKVTMLPSDGVGAKDKTPEWQPKLPVVGPIIVALLPLAALASVLYLTVSHLGRAVVTGVPADQVRIDLPISAGAFWDQLRGLVTLSEGTLAALAGADVGPPQTLLFVYLMICLTVRLAPYAGNIRGQFGALLAVCAVASISGSVIEDLPDRIVAAWPLLALVVGWLLLLMIGSLLVRGVVASGRLIFSQE